MRLIDADALKECMRGEFIDSVEERIAIREIESAPTIEPPEEFEWCTDCKEYDQEKHCCHRWTKVIRKTIAEIEEEYKPKRGEWIELDELDGGYWKCSACGTPTEAYSAFKIYAYCPFCGARMEDVKHLPHIKRLKGADDE